MNVKLLQLTLFAWLLLGCADTDTTVKTSPDGIKYKIVIIEGRKFVATRTAYDYWTLAGPID